MRTTLSLDDDVAAQLEQLRRQRDRSYEQIVDDVLQVGLPVEGEDRRDSGSARFDGPEWFDPVAAA